jgi:SulP family sulfate permease
LLFVLFATDLMAYVPMATLAAILFMVAWGMSEYQRFLRLLRMSNDDRAVLLLTFGLTVLVDLTVAIGVGITLAALLFMMRMSQAVEVESGARVDPDLDEEDLSQRDLLPDGVEVYRIHGPFFFGVAGELLETLRRAGSRPRAIILRMRLVPYLDASGVRSLEEFVGQAWSGGTRIILSGVQPQPASMLARASLGPDSGKVLEAADYDEALRLAAQATAM